MNGGFTREQWAQLEGRYTVEEKLLWAIFDDCPPFDELLARPSDYRRKANIAQSQRAQGRAKVMASLGLEEGTLLSTVVREELAKLPPVEARIMQRRLYRLEDVAEIASELGLSEERVCEIQELAIEYLKESGAVAKFQALLLD